MVKQSVKTGQRQPLTWSMVLSCLLATIGLIAFTSFTMVHWVEKQILTTDTWVQTVGQLPKNDAVASSLSTYTVNQLFTATDLENRIEQALPERAGFLASPLANHLDTFLTNQTKNVIQSDQFTAVWIAANNAVFTRIVDGARAPAEDSAPPAERARLAVPLGVLRDSINQVLTNRGIINEGGSNRGASELIVDLKTSVSNIQEYIRLVDFLYATLWLVAIVCVLGALVFSRNRRRLLLIITIAVAIIALLQLIGVRALRPTLLNFFADASAMTAAGVVYDTLLASFRTASTWVFVIAIISSIVIFLASPRILRKSKTVAKWMDSYKQSAVWRFGGQVRAWVAQYQWYIVGLTALVGLTLTAFLIPVSWQNASLTLLFIILIAELTSLIAARRRENAPMKHTGTTK